ncbi:putative oxidoreductase C terminal-domain-containing protein [Naematelia encephala]|uniref:Putative oxidoreductase C terminal-domain-containing protein n=1 Tax=Naematelia encephala TaxID=71784 RepID=A0A1Y2AZD1_9TREE|nr:putative oxidoreductase C terminal-domain-containing protein [Naematelia encephala]
MRPSQLRNLGITRLLRATEGMGSNGPVPKANLLPVTGPQVKVLIIGAGNINFGSEEGPWNHSQRLERKLGTRLKVIGLVDPAVARAQAVLEAKSLTFAAPAYSSTEIYASVQAAVSGLSSEPPDVIILGSPPAFRGTTDASKGFDTEVQLSSGFPSSALFVEKPVSTGLVEEVRLVADLLETRKGNLVSVGYMLRYSAAVRKMKEIIKENELNVMMTSARYIMAYEASRKLAWWDKRIDGGPIVEQATHFCDLSRYFGGEVDLDSVMAHSLEWYEKPGHLSKIQVNELQIPEDERIPRFTSATWKYESGALGHLEHGVSLQGSDFNTELAVYADGYLLKLVDPYNRPTLYVRRPGSDSEEVHAFHDDDPFLSEMSSFIDMATTGKAEVPILSSYADAVRTYEMTWAIRWASEKTRRLRT